MIHYYNKDIDYLFRHKRVISSWVESVILSKNKKPGSINFIFTSDSELLEMNKQFLSHDYRTDVLTFDTSSYKYGPTVFFIDDDDDTIEPEFISGDIFISIDTVRRNAKLYHQKMSFELYRVIIHGVLHLLGYEDITSEEKIRMTQQENLALSKLNLND